MIWLIGFTWITPEWLHNYIVSGKGKAIIIDVRTPLEHRKGFIPGTKMLIPHNQISARIKEIKADPEKDTIIVYCRSGNRSTIAAKILESKGFKHVLNLKGGINAWKKKGYKVVKEKEEKK